MLPIIAFEEDVDVALDRMLEEVANLLSQARVAVPGPEGECLDVAACSIQHEQERRANRRLLRCLGPAA